MLIKEIYIYRKMVLAKFSGKKLKYWWYNRKYKKMLKGGNNMKWWKAAGIRAIKTVAQTAVATIGTAVVIEEVNWLMVLSASVLSGILSLLTSAAGLPEVKE